MWHAVPIVFWQPEHIPYVLIMWSTLTPQRWISVNTFLQTTTATEPNFIANFFIRNTNNVIWKNWPLAGASLRCVDCLLNVMIFSLKSHTHNVIQKLAVYAWHTLYTPTTLTKTVCSITNVLIKFILCGYNTFLCYHWCPLCNVLTPPQWIHWPPFLKKLRIKRFPLSNVFCSNTATSLVFISRHHIS